MNTPQLSHKEEEKAKDFFINIFVDDISENEMPALSRRPDVLPVFDTECVRLIELIPVEAAAKKYGVTVNDLLLSAAGLTTAKYCGSEDIVLGISTSGNTLPLRINAPALMNVDEYMTAVAGAVSNDFDDSVMLRGSVADLMFCFSREDENLRLTLSYSRRLYQDEIASNMLEQLVTILSRLATDDKRTTLGDITELPESQSKQILKDFKGEHCDENLGKTLVDLFREQAKKTPDNHAVVFAERRLTYAELDDITDRVAANVSNRGSVVGILVGRSEMLPVCTMGVMKSGAAYLPLDPIYPAERLEFMLEDAGVSVVIADEELKHFIPGYSGDFLFTKDIYGLPAQKIIKSPQPQDTMILLYTSGTTGRPKGIILTHSNYVNFCTWYRNHQSMTERDNVSAYASIGFDAHLMEFYPTLISGACLYIVPEDKRLDLPGLQDYFGENNINIVFLGTQLGRQFAGCMSSKGLRALVVGGETLVPLVPPDNYELYNLYGPTECTVLITAFQVDMLYDRVPVGKAINNTALYIVDKQNRLAPVGVAGELCIAGRQVSKGYLNMPELTLKKFVPNPFDNNPDYAIMYRTGDIARFLPDGNIDFIGRSDFQIKIRGFRVEPAEIEECIREHPAIRDSVVVAVDAPGGGMSTADKCAVAYIVSDSIVDVPELNRFIEEKLPAYMIPAAIIQIDAVPLSPNGKVDRKKLPIPEFTAHEEESVRPLNDLETQISEIIAEILGHGQFGLTTSLTQSGFTSLSAIKLSALILEKLGINIPVTEIIKNPTLLSIENACITLLLSAKASKISKSAENQKEYPLSQSQLGLYYECIKNPDSLVYNIPYCLIMDGNTDVKRLQKAITEIIKVHPGLRTRFFLRDGEIRQGDRGTIDFLTEDMSVDEADMSVIKSEFVRPFNLFDEPLFRTKICKTQQKTYLLLDAHHIIFDGTSLDIFMRELSEAYSGKPLVNEALTSFDQALAEKKQEGTAEYRTAEAFYDSLIKKSDGATVLPYDHKEGEKRGLTETVSINVSKKSVAKGIEIPAITPSTLFLGSTVFVTGRFAATRNVGIAAISGGRSNALLNGSIGMFVKTLPLVFYTGSAMSVTDYLNTVQETMYGAMENEIYPFSKIVDKYRYYPQILFAYQGSLITRYEIGGKPVEMDTLIPDFAKFPIDVTVVDDGTSYRLTIVYDSGRFSRYTMETYAGCISHITQQFANHHRSCLSDFSIASAKQLELVNSFSTPPEAPLANSVHTFFERYAQKKPDALALTAPDGRFSYGQLNSRANRIAHALLEMGVKKGEKIAFILPRTSHVFSAIYGILKAGCAFIPIDPTYPHERICHILTDSESRFFITGGSDDYLNGLDINSLLECPQSQNPDIPVSPEDLCYVIYTSGSTGKPKGVKLAHRGIVNYSSPFERNTAVIEVISKSDTYISVTTVSFDAFLHDVFVPLSNGLHVVMADEEQIGNPNQLSYLCSETGASAISTTPSVIMQYAENPEMRHSLSKFNTLIIGSEEFPVPLYKSLREVTDAVIINCYGPTEATVDCNCKIITDEDTGVIPVGPPESGVGEQIMDMDGNPLPVGVTGELWIGGPGVAIGYIGNPELTAEKFVIRNGIMYYRSGDLAKWNQKGEVLILGRNDNQIKLRGQRIEPGEIERVIVAYSGITRAVILLSKINGQEHLCAYFTANKEIDITDLRTEISKILPKYMVPTAYRQLSTMPLTPNGKIDVKAMPDAVLMAGDRYEAPATKIEAAFCKIFAEALGLERVGVNDSFFNIGGTSLSATRVVIAAEAAGLRDKNGKSLAYSNVFTHPTPKSLANLLSSRCETTAVSPMESQYDYSGIHSMLASGNLDSLKNGGTREIGNVLLTGATGFLGIHMLYGLLNNTTGNITCLVRRSKSVSADKRLSTLYYYYFEETCDVGDRLKVIEGDMTDESCLSPVGDVDTIINCAANVMHFAGDSDAFDVNTAGVHNLIRFCQKRRVRLIQISTVGIAGFSIDGFPPKDTVMDETMLFFGQNLENRYLHSKFMAEYAVLEAALKGLDVKIMRVGNLMARYGDGLFQINAMTNSFIGDLRAYDSIGCFPYSSYRTAVELSPVGNVTDSILSLAEASELCRVFHPYNNHNILLGDIIVAMQKSGMNIEMVEDDIFEHALSVAMKNPAHAEKLTSLIAYQNITGGMAAFAVAVKNDYTTDALIRRGRHWPQADDDYLRKFLSGLKDMGLFGDKDGSLLHS